MKKGGKTGRTINPEYQRRKQEIKDAIETAQLRRKAGIPDLSTLFSKESAIPQSLLGLNDSTITYSRETTSFSNPTGWNK